MTNRQIWFWERFDQMENANLLNRVVKESMRDAENKNEDFY